MSSASPPRTSPTTRRSGRIRSAARTSSRTATAPAPSAFAGRASSRTTCGCGSRSSAVSSIVTMRSTRVDRPRQRVAARRLARARSRPRRRCSNPPAPSLRGTRRRPRRQAEGVERDVAAPRTGGSSGTDRRARAAAAPRAGASRRRGGRRPSATRGRAASPSGAMTRSPTRTIVSASSVARSTRSEPAVAARRRRGPGRSP